MTKTNYISRRTIRENSRELFLIGSGMLVWEIKKIKKLKDCDLDAAQSGSQKNRKFANRMDSGWILSGLQISYSFVNRMSGSQTTNQISPHFLIFGL